MIKLIELTTRSSQNIIFISQFTKDLHHMSDFRKIHLQLIQENQLNSLLSSELDRQRKSIESTIKKIIIDLRSYCLLDIWYPKVSEARLLQFLDSPIYKRENRKVFPSTSKLPFPSSITSPVNTFLQNITPNMNIILKCIHIYFHTTTKIDPIKYIPTENTFLFFASSTFPSLFGYNWCTEDGRLFVSSIIKLVEMVYNQHGKSFVNSNFRNSYIRDLIRQFFHVSGITRFLQLSLSNELTLLLADERLVNIDDNSMEYIEILLEYADRIYKGFINSMPKMPSIIKYFFSAIYQFAVKNSKEGSDEAKQLVDWLFFDVIVFPAIINPKVFALIPETSISTRSPHLPVITKIFHINDNLLQKYPGIKTNPHYIAIDFNEIFNHLTHFDEELEGVSGVLIQKVTSTSYHLLLMSLNDVLFLGHIISETIDRIDCSDKEKDSIRSAIRFKSLLNLENDELIDFWVKSYDALPTNNKVSSNSLDELCIPIVEKHDPIEIDPNLFKSMKHLITYLQEIQPTPNEPPTLKEFLELQCQIAEKNMSTELITKTNAIKTKLDRLEMDEDTILKNVELIITKKLDDSANSFASSFKHQECLTGLQTLSKSVTLLNQQLLPIMHQSVIRKFLNQNSDIQLNLKSRMKEMSTMPSSLSPDTTTPWADFFVECTKKLQKYSSELGLDNTHNMRLIKQLHSVLVSEITFKYFMSNNPLLTETDQKLVNFYESGLKKFTEDDNSKTIKQLMASPSCFDSAIECLRTGFKLGAPLEKMAKINESLVIIQDIYLFEFGEGCPADDFLPLFVFVLLKAKLPNLASLNSYMEYFLLNLSEKIKILDSKEMYVMITFVSAIQHILSLI